LEELAKMSRKYRVVIEVYEVRGHCPLYQVGDKITVEWFYIDSKSSSKICLHALTSISTLLSKFMQGVSAKELGIGSGEDVGYLQCPDPGPPYTKGGTVIFKLRRKTL